MSDNPTKQFLIKTDMTSEEIAYFDEAARLRDVSVTQLVKRLVEIIAKDRMLLSIFDDDDRPSDLTRGGHYRRKSGRAPAPPATVAQPLQDGTPAPPPLREKKPAGRPRSSVMSVDAGATAPRLFPVKRQEPSKAELRRQIEQAMFNTALMETSQ